MVRIHAGEPNCKSNSLEDACRFSVRILYRGSIACDANAPTLLAERGKHGFEAGIHARAGEAALYAERSGRIVRSTLGLLGALRLSFEAPQFGNDPL